jgi:hypothetical protein
LAIPVFGHPCFRPSFFGHPCFRPSFFGSAGFHTTAFTQQSGLHTTSQVFAQQAGVSDNQPGSHTTVRTRLSDNSGFHTTFQALRQQIRVSYNFDRDYRQRHGFRTTHRKWVFRQQ